MKSNILELYVKPNSSETRIDGLYDGRIKVKISSPQEKGKANKELIRFIASLTGVSAINIRLISGITSNYKRVSIDGDPDLDYSDIILNNSRN